MLLKERGVNVVQTCRDFGVHQAVLRNWVADFRSDSAAAFAGQGQLSAHRRHFQIEKVTLL
jgi:transposase-like protein